MRFIVVVIVIIIIIIIIRTYIVGLSDLKALGKIVLEKELHYLTLLMGDHKI